MAHNDTPGSTEEPNIPHFGEWIRGVARELYQSRSQLPYLLDDRPGSEGEAVALVTSEHMLAPDEEGAPFLYRHGGDVEGPPDPFDYLDLLVIALYLPYYKELIAASCGKPFSEVEPHEFILLSDYLEPQAVLDYGLKEPAGGLYLHIAGVQVGQHKDVLLFSEPRLALGGLAATNRQDLLRIYELVGRARERV